MAVRVKVIIRDKISGREVIANALANSGFEATTRKILIPRRVAELLGLWPVPEDAEVLPVEADLRDHLDLSEVEPDLPGVC